MEFGGGDFLDVERTPKQDAAIDNIRSRMVGGCGSKEFSALRCPVCDGGIDFHVHPRGRIFYVRCQTSAVHMGFHAVTCTAPAWWVAHRDGLGVWVADAKSCAAADGGGGKVSRV